MYMCRCIHLVHMVSCTCDSKHMFCRWCFVQVVMRMCCTYATSVYFVFCEFCRCCAVYMWHYVCVLCSFGIVTCVVILLCNVQYVYFFILYTRCRYIYYVALYIGYICMNCVVYWVYVYAFFVLHVVCECMSSDVDCVCVCFMVCSILGVVICIMLCCTLSVHVCVVFQVQMHVLHGVVCHVQLYVWDLQYVCVHIVEEKELHVYWLLQPIQSSYEIRKKVEAKD